MGRDEELMKRPLLLAVVLVLSAASVYAADTLKTPYKTAWYAKHYPFMQGKENVWTFESEFLWPEGFRRLDEKKLTGYQFWISHLPLWHYGQGVGSLARGMVLMPEKISRTLNLPWRTTKFYDCVIPLQLLAEYMLYLKKPNELAYRPKIGDPLTYPMFLKNDVAYDAHGRILFTPVKERTPSDSLFNAFLDLVAVNTNYASLESNCESVPDSSVLPGDLLIGRDSLGTSGKVVTVLLVAGNNAGETRYIVGFGCDDGCDLYIPLSQENRVYPWLTLDEVKGLVVRPHVGFYRPIVPGEKHKK
jgi:hypothetical protein